jgi:hypothetical protein
MLNAPKTTAEIIAEGAAELIELCNRLPNKRLARAAQRAFRRAAELAAEAAVNRDGASPRASASATTRPC